MEMEYVLQVSVRSFLLFFVRNLTGLLCCSAVATVSSGQPRPVVSVAYCDGRVSLCVRWSRELFIIYPYDTHRLCNPSSSSRCEFDGFPGVWRGLASLLYFSLLYMLPFSVRCWHINDSTCISTSEWCNLGDLWAVTAHRSVRLCYSSLASSRCCYS